MTTNNVQASAVAAPQQQMPPTSQNAASPPSKRDLASWWKTFKKNARREEEKGEVINLLRQYPILVFPKQQPPERHPRATTFDAVLCQPTTASLRPGSCIYRLIFVSLLDLVFKLYVLTYL